MPDPIDIEHDIVDELRGFAAGSESARASLMRAAADEIERLRRWKAEAMAVHSDWEKTWIAAGRPGRIGTSKAVAVRDEIERLRGEGDWEYAWAGEDWLLEDEVFPSPQVAENWVGLLSTRRWVREEGGYLVRRRAAGPWERVEGDGDA